MQASSGKTVDTKYEMMQYFTAPHPTLERFEVHMMAHATHDRGPNRRAGRGKEKGGKLRNKLNQKGQKLRSSEPANSSQPAPRGHVGFRAVDNVRTSRTVLLGVERPVGRVDRDLGPFLFVTVVVAVVAVVVVEVMDDFLDPFSLGDGKSRT